MALDGMYGMKRAQKGMDVMEDEMRESDIDNNSNGEGGIGENDTTYIG